MNRTMSYTQRIKKKKKKKSLAQRHIQGVKVDLAFPDKTEVHPDLYVVTVDFR